MNSSLYRQQQSYDFWWFIIVNCNNITNQLYVIAILNQFKCNLIANSLLMESEAFSHFLSTKFKQKWWQHCVLTHFKALGLLSHWDNNIFTKKHSFYSVTILHRRKRTDMFVILFKASIQQLKASRLQLNFQTAGEVSLLQSLLWATHIVSIYTRLIRLHW